MSHAVQQLAEFLPELGFKALELIESVWMLIHSFFCKADDFQVILYSSTMSLDEGAGYHPTSSKAFGDSGRHVPWILANVMGQLWTVAIN